MSRLQDKSCTFHFTFNRVSMEIGNRVVSVNIHVIPNNMLFDIQKYCDLVWE